jgi:hypothetical protein
VSQITVGETNAGSSTAQGSQLQIDGPVNPLQVDDDWLRQLFRGDSGSRHFDDGQLEVMNQALHQRPISEL